MLEPTGGVYVIVCKNKKHASQAKTGKKNKTIKIFPYTRCINEKVRGMHFVAYMCLCGQK